MSAALHDPPDLRATRLSALVNAAEAETIARRAAESGLSVSAFLRARALGPADSPEEGPALRAVDEAIARMGRELDLAIAAIGAAMARLERA